MTAFGVGSNLELYTTVLGWQQYGSIWDVLVGTGLVFIPFLAIIIGNFIEPVMQAPGPAAAAASLRRTEWDLIVTFLVVIIVAHPSVPLNAKELNFTPICTGETKPEPITLGSDNTEVTLSTFKEFNPALQALINEEVPAAQKKLKVPLWWFSIISLSSGFSESIKRGLPCPNDLRGLMTAMDRDTSLPTRLIDDLSAFSKLCFKEARKKYFQGFSGQNKMNEIDILARDPDDLNWIGSQILADNLYGAQVITDHYLASWAATVDKSPEYNTYSKAGIPVNVVGKSGKAYTFLFGDANPAGNPGNCAAWWFQKSKTGGATFGLRNELRVMILGKLFGTKEEVRQGKKTYPHQVGGNDIFDDEEAFLFRKAFGVFDEKGVKFLRFSTMGDEFIKKSGVDEFKESKSRMFFMNELIKKFTLQFSAGQLMAMDAEQTNGTAANGVAQNMGNTLNPSSAVGSLVGGLYNVVASNVGTALGGFVLYPVIYVIKQIYPMIIALLLCSIYMLLPIGLLLSRFRLEFVVVASVLIFAVKGLDFCMYVAWWFDENLLMAASNQRNVFSTIAHFTGLSYLSGEHRLMQMVASAMYIAFPMLWLAIIGMAGYKVGQAVSGFASALGAAPAKSAAAAGKVGAAVATGGVSGAIAGAGGAIAAGGKGMQVLGGAGAGAKTGMARALGMSGGKGSAFEAGGKSVGGADDGGPTGGQKLQASTKRGNEMLSKAGMGSVSDKDRTKLGRIGVMGGAGAQQATVSKMQSSSGGFNSGILDADFKKAKAGKGGGGKTT